tara:strand:+ start:5624 stop:5752 length:129 start_codon:yes stop_codon:yes gene_type:complete
MAVISHTREDIIQIPGVAITHTPVDQTMDIPMIIIAQQVAVE